MFWTPAFAGVTSREKVIIFGNGYKVDIIPSQAQYLASRHASVVKGLNNRTNPSWQHRDNLLEIF